MTDQSYSAAILIVIVLMTLAPNNEQQAVDAMFKCRAINAEPQALYDCMNYQGFKVAEPGSHFKAPVGRQCS